VITRLLISGFLIGLFSPIHAQDVSRPDVPEKIKAPATETVILRALASGSQIYTCQQGRDAKYSWTLKAPDAELRDSKGSVIGRHFAGPTWKAGDGSEVTGKAVARVDSPDPDSIPWLLVTATGHSGQGIFSRVVTIQRIHTHAGQPPPATACSPSKQGLETKSNYTAEYVFYAPGN
jgi:Protein of unknown function (DUF3455)